MDMNTKEILSQAAHSFGIGEIHTLIPATKGLANETYFASTDRGEYVLRILKSQTLEGLRNEVSIETQLRAAGILTVELQQDAEGKYCVDIQGNRITCSKRITGIHPEVTTEFARKLGITLARYSQAITSLPEKTTSLLLKEIVSKEVESLPDTTLGTRIKKQLTESLDIFDQDLPTGFIHSDLHTNNLLVTPEGEIAVFDFGDTDRNLLLLDLATSARSLYWGGKNADAAALRSLIEGYESIRILSAKEKEYFNKAVLYSSAAVSTWLYNHGYESTVEDAIKGGDAVVLLSAHRLLNE